MFLAKHCWNSAFSNLHPCRRANEEPVATVRRESTPHLNLLPAFRLAGFRTSLWE